MPPDIASVLQAGKGKAQKPFPSEVFYRRDTLSKDSHQHKCVTGPPLAQRETEIVILAGYLTAPKNQLCFSRRG